MQYPIPPATFPATASSARILGLLSLLVIAPCSAQAPVLTEQVDEFTGARTIMVRPKDHGPGPEYAWVSNNGQCQLLLRWKQDGRVPAVILQGDTLMVKLENDRVLVLTSATVATGEHAQDPNGKAVTYTSCVYDVTPNQLLEISANWMQKMRVRFYEGWQTWSCVNDPRWQYGFSEAAAALVENGGLGPGPIPRSLTEPKVLLTSQGSH